MGNLRSFALLALGFAPALLHAAAYQVVVEVQDPRGKPFAEPAQKLCEEWYPKFNEALFGPDYELPFKEVKVIFEGEIVFQNGKDRVVIPAYTDGNTIHVNSKYTAEFHKRAPNDYLGMVAHELAHVVQHYENGAAAGWLVEGIADYVRHKYYEKDIEPRLHLDAKGNLMGMELGRNKGEFATQGYLAGYTVTGAFIDWLEVRKDSDIVPTLSRALRGNRYTDALFQSRCGASLEDLWGGFVEQSKK